MPPIFSRRRSDSEPQAPGVKDILEKEGDHWHFAYTKGRMFDLEEQLHLQLFWFRVVSLWFFFFTPALMAVSAVAYFGLWQLTQPAYLHGITAASVLTAPLVAYRQYRRVRRTRHDIRRLNWVRRHELADSDGDDGGPSALPRQKRYRHEMVDVIATLRERASRNSRIHNYLQGVIIVGSVAASAVTTASVAYSETRWVAVGLTAAMGLAAGFSGYYKFHDRSLSSRQAADSIEREYEAVELRVGRYKGLSEEDAYAHFAEVVERIRDEHAKRQQQLDQHMQVKRDEPRE